MAAAIVSENCTMVGADALGSTTRNIVVTVFAPNAIAASTYSSRLTESVCPYVMRANVGANSTPITAISVPGPGPYRVTASKARMMGGNARMTSTMTRMVTMRVIVDVILAFPPIILDLLAVTLYGPGPGTLIAVMGVLFAPTFARITYGQTLSVKREEYVEAAIAFGAKTVTTMFRVVLPNASAPTIVQFSLTIAAAILLESGLSFLGLCVVPPTPSWGSMVAQGSRYLSSSPHVLLVPG